MKILMLTEFFYPYDRGGSEWSTYYLAKSLTQIGHQIVILTPNYGTVAKQTWKGLQIIRFRMGKTLKESKTPISPLWHTSPGWVLKSTQALLSAIRTYHPDIIHIQGKYFLPAAGMAKIITKTPTIATLRDYQTLCNLGLCLWNKKRRCSPKEFFVHELKQYNKQYSSIGAVRAILGRLTSIWLRLWIYSVDKVVCISEAQAKIFAANGINAQIIYNTMHFEKTSLQKKSFTSMHILSVGRLTPGKGAHLVIPIFAKCCKAFPSLQLKIVGDGPLKSKLQQQAQKFDVQKQVTFISTAAHKQVMSMYKAARVVLVPSLWPEPFGRVALEAIACGTPVVSSNRGGLPEIVQQKYGIATNPEVNSLAIALNKVLKNYSQFHSRILKDQVQLRDQFTVKPVNQYQKLYEQIHNSSVSLSR